MGGGAWWAAVHGVSKSQTRLSEFTLTFHFHALEKEMATHSSSCLENPRDGGASWAAIYGVAQSQTRLKWLSSSSSSLQKALLCKVINISIYYNNNIKMLEIWSGEEGNRYFHSAFHSPDTLHCFSHLVKLHYFIRKATYSYILWLPW